MSTRRYWNVFQFCSVLGVDEKWGCCPWCCICVRSLVADPAAATVSVSGHCYFCVMSLLFLCQVAIVCVMSPLFLCQVTVISMSGHWWRCLWSCPCSCFCVRYCCFYVRSLLFLCQVTGGVVSDPVSAAVQAGTSVHPGWSRCSSRPLTYSEHWSDAQNAFPTLTGRCLTQ